MRPEFRHEQRAETTFWLWIAALIAICAGIAATLYTQYIRKHNPTVAADIEPEHVDPFTDVPVPEAVPVFVEPAAPSEVSEELQVPLPELEDSDSEFLGWLGELVGVDTVAQFVVPQSVIRNIVVTIDNLPRNQIRIEQRPIAPTPGRFLTTGSEDDAPVLAPENYSRYTPFVMLVRSTDSEIPLMLYGRFRPLFQEAYEDLGYPGRSFDTRLIEVIDHLLGTPDLRDPIPLVQPRVMYQYADPQIEAQSAGRKLLIRMGAANVAIIKDKLRELRAGLVREAAEPQADRALE